MSELIDQLESIATKHPSWNNISSLVNKELEQIEDWITENSGHGRERSSRTRDGLLQSFPQGSEGRSLFDDVDL
jgi:hypothetical protein